MNTRRIDRTTAALAEAARPTRAEYRDARDRTAVRAMARTMLAVDVDGWSGTPDELAAEHAAARADLDALADLEAADLDVLARDRAADGLSRTPGAAETDRSLADLTERLAEVDGLDDDRLAAAIRNATR